VRDLVRAQREMQGKTAGWRPIYEALADTRPAVSLTLVQAELSALKRAERVEEQRRQEEARVSHEFVAREAAWGEDTTHLGRLDDGTKVEGEVVKDLGTLETVGLSVGGVPCAQTVSTLLAQAAEERGGYPLVWMGDQGSINRSEEVSELLEQEQVVHLLSRVHTPTDNGGTEHQHRELKEEGGLGRGVELGSVEAARERMERARVILDGGRLRATKGWRTAQQLGAELPRATDLVDRAAFYEAACRAMEEAARGLTQRQAVLQARRQALFRQLVRFGLAVRHVGRRPRVRRGPPRCCASRDDVECACARG